VVALVTNVPGPLAAARLRALGARVVKVEPPHGDPLEAAAPQWYAEIVAGMERVRLNLRDAADQARLHERLSESQLLVTAARTGALRRAGIDWDALHAKYPRLSQVAVVGEAAPNDDRAGHDLTYQARAGLLSPPAMPRSVYADIAAAERAVSAALAALLRSARGREAVRLEVPIVEAAASFAEPLRYGLTAPSGPLGGALPAYNVYRSADGWVAVAALEEHFAGRLLALLGAERLDAPALERAMLARSSAAWEAFASEHDLPLAAIFPEKG